MDSVTSLYVSMWVEPVSPPCNNVVVKRLGWIRFPIVWNKALLHEVCHGLSLRHEDIVREFQDSLAAKSAPQRWNIQARLLHL